MFRYAVRSSSIMQIWDTMLNCPRISIYMQYSISFTSLSSKTHLEVKHQLSDLLIINLFQYYLYLFIILYCRFLSVFCTACFGWRYLVSLSSARFLVVSYPLPLPPLHPFLVPLQLECIKLYCLRIELKSPFVRQLLLPWLNSFYYQLRGRCSRAALEVPAKGLLEPPDPLAAFQPAVASNPHSQLHLIWGVAMHQTSSRDVCAIISYHIYVYTARSCLIQICGLLPLLLLFLQLLCIYFNCIA